MTEPRFSHMEDLMAGSGLLMKLLPADHPIHAIFTTIRLLVDRANENPDCSECVALVGFSALALKNADMDHLEQLSDLCMATSTALTLFDLHDEEPSDG
jgi:hypothetical protein